MISTSSPVGESGAGTGDENNGDEKERMGKRWIKSA
jgi:hypothetical protein